MPPDCVKMSKSGQEASSNRVKGEGKYVGHTLIKILQSSLSLAHKEFKAQDLARKIVVPEYTSFMQPEDSPP